MATTMEALPFLDPARGRLGLRPLDPAQWLLRDASFAVQMRERERLLETLPRDTLHAPPDSGAAQAALLAHVLSALTHDAGYDVGDRSVRRPDGSTVAINHAAPMATVGRLVQADYCLLRPAAGGHVLSAAVLCFPSRWVLAEKAGRPLDAIHGPVPTYGADYARRVQRIFDGLQEGRPVERFNGTLNETPVLYQPRHAPPRAGAWLRMERQTLLRLPGIDAIAFGIHTSVQPVEVFASGALIALRAMLLGQSPAEIAYHGGAACHGRLAAYLDAVIDAKAREEENA